MKDPLTETFSSMVDRINRSTPLWDLHEYIQTLTFGYRSITPLAFITLDDCNEKNNTQKEILKWGLSLVFLIILVFTGLHQVIYRTPQFNTGDSHLALAFLYGMLISIRNYLALKCFFVFWSNAGRCNWVKVWVSFFTLTTLMMCFDTIILGSNNNSSLGPQIFDWDQLSLSWFDVWDLATTHKPELVSDWMSTVHKGGMGMVNDTIRVVNDLPRNAMKLALGK